MCNPAEFSDAEIEQMVDRLFLPEDEDFTFERLEKIGRRAVPFLIRALERENAAAEFEPDGLLNNSPLERICGLLEPFGSPEAVPPLAVFLDHPSAGIRRSTAMALANIGAPDCVELVLKALDDPDVRSFAMMGICSGENRLSERFRSDVFPAIARLFNRSDEPGAERAAQTLLALDAQRASPVLLASDQMTVDGPRTRDVLRALNEARQKIPHDLLLPLLHQLQSRLDQRRSARIYAEALVAYALHPDEGAREMVEVSLTLQNEIVARGAARALALLEGVAEARDVVLDIATRGGIDKLTPAQRHYFAVHVYNAEVTNGGHSQFFVNSSGQHWKTAIDGLEAIGAPTRAEILREATSLFGPAGPHEDNEIRANQISRFSVRDDGALNALDERYYAGRTSENVHVLLARYAVRHKHDFQGPTPPEG